ncbi:putative mitochondrial protein [Cucumis melo var. makuwa]|uniref:Putative mitochondrial protein n=1 Tax=Cucumis melo var. makuwa TaxID=1194695 RepID=A0A5D3BD55_CUCMM|nr:putative mitochondrial protein [Cucumis melo var. makuwa]
MKILYAEADQKLVNFLFRILTLPVGTMANSTSGTKCRKCGQFMTTYSDNGQLTNGGEKTVVESSMETPTSTPPSSAPLTPQSYHSPSSNDETFDELPSQRFRSMEDIYNSSQFALMVSDLVCYDEAASKEEWQQAMKEEMTAIEKNGTWKMVDLPEGKNAIGLKWVYKTKFATYESLEKHKARLVTKGYAQQHGIDFEKTFSPVAGSKP